MPVVVNSCSLAQQVKRPAIFYQQVARTRPTTERLTTDTL